MWAAYRRGAFDEVTFIGRELTPAAFSAAIRGFVENLMKAGGEAFVFAREFPVGLVILMVDGDYAEPHVIWFPEATRRNRLEMALGFLVEMKKRFKLLLWVRTRHWKLYDHLCKYGVIRTVGKVRGHYPDGEDAFFFQGVR